MNYEDFFLEHLGLIDQIIRFIARRHHLSATEQEDFAGVVRLKLIENDYAIFRKFQHRSSLRTYLTTVIQRIFLDWRIASWGKWRSSAEARRLGPHAVLLERLVTRDGLSADEAIEMLRANHGVALPVAELRALLDRLPRRTPRRRVSDDELADVPARDCAPDDGLMRGDQAARAARLSAALAAAQQALPDQDAVLVRLRFIDGLQVSTIARTQQADQKAMYRRLERLKATLRAALEAQGFSAGDVQGFFGSDRPEDPES